MEFNMCFYAFGRLKMKNEKMHQYTIKPKDSSFTSSHGDNATVSCD